MLRRSYCLIDYRVHDANITGESIPRTANDYPLDLE